MSRSAETHWPLTLIGGGASLLNFLLPVVMTRVLPVEQVGEFKVFFLWLMAFPALSFSSGLLNGLYTWAGRGEERVMKSAIAASVVLGVLATIASFVIPGPVSPWVFSAAIFPVVVGPFWEGALLSRGQVWRGAWVGSGFEILRLIAVLSALFFTKSLQGVLIAHLIVSWIKVLSFLGVALKKSWIRIAWPDWNLVRPYALPVSLAAIFELCLSNADRFVLAKLLSSPDFAVYAFGCLMVPPLFIFEQAVNQVLVPRLAEEFREGRPSQALRLWRNSVEELEFVLIPAALGLMVLARPLVTILFTDAYLEAADFLVLFAPSYILLGLSHDVVARARGESAWILRTTMQFGAGSLVAAGSGAWIGGAKGALVAWILVMTARKFWALRWATLSQGWHGGELLPYRSIRSFGVAAVMAMAATGIVINFFDLSHLTQILFGGGVFGLVYLAVARALAPSAVSRVLASLRTLMRRRQ